MKQKLSNEFKKKIRRFLIFNQYVREKIYLKITYSFNSKENIPIYLKKKKNLLNGEYMWLYEGVYKGHNSLKNNSVIKSTLF